MRTPKECADVLAQIFTSSFSGEAKGTYRIQRDEMKGITGRPVIHQTIIEDVADWLVELGLVLIDRDAYFVVAPPAMLDDVRAVSDDVLNQFHHPVKFGSA
ncbi:MAG: hypothetical protein HQ501_08410 [Rhodospirillales bacterium]|nr:hypothetical protein [Rhodospirillales bacterium]